MKHFFTLLAASLVSGLVLTTPVSAAGLAENGTINSVNLKAGYLVVDDGKYTLSPNIRVYLYGQAAALSTLKRGMQVSFNSVSQAGGGDGSDIITELTILSSKKDR